MRRRGAPSGAGAGLLLAAYVYGSFMAMVVSYVNNGSVVWAAVHSVLSWVYVLYSVAAY